jgi:hypothetical protein
LRRRAICRTKEKELIQLSFAQFNRLYFKIIRPINLFTIEQQPIHIAKKYWLSDEEI